MKPNLLRDVNEEFQTYNLEEASVKRKISSNKNKGYSVNLLGKSINSKVCFVITNVCNLFTTDISKKKDESKSPSKLCGNLDDLYYLKPSNICAKHDKSLLELQVNGVVNNQKCYEKISYDRQKETTENTKLFNRLKELEDERNELDKQRSSSCVSRNLIYPIAMLLLLVLTSITVLLVVQNTIELLIGIKALPLSSRVRKKSIPSLTQII